MAPLSSAVKKNSGQKHSRKELMNKSPIPWLVLIVITLIASAFAIYPNAQEWMEKKAELKEMVTLIPQLESEKQSLTSEKDQLNEAFKDKARPYVQRADQRFPVTIDPTTMAQTIEIYSILMERNYVNNQFELNSLNVGQPKNVDGSPYAESAVNMSVVVDRVMLAELIEFIQTGVVTNDLQKKVIESGGGETASIEFLKSNLLPVGIINSISLNEETGDEDSRVKIPVYNVQLQILFYSEPV